MSFLLDLGLRPRTLTPFLTLPEVVGGLFVRGAGFGGGGKGLTPLRPEGGLPRFRRRCEIVGRLVTAIGDEKVKQ